MLKAENSKLLVEIALNSDSKPSTRISACDLIYKISLLPASEIIRILQETIDDYRCTDSYKVKALALMDKVDDSRSNENDITPDDREAVEQQLLSEYLDVKTDSNTGEVQEPRQLPQV